MYSACQDSPFLAWPALSCPGTRPCTSPLMRSAGEPGVCSSLPPAGWNIARGFDIQKGTTQTAVFYPHNGQTMTTSRRFARHATLCVRRKDYTSDLLAAQGSRMRGKEPDDYHGCRHASH